MVSLFVPVDGWGSNGFLGIIQIHLLQSKTGDFVNGV